MLKKIFILSIFILIISTTLIKNHTKNLDEQIFSVKENINYLNSVQELVQLEHDYLSSPEKLLKHKDKIITDIDLVLYLESGWNVVACFIVFAPTGSHPI